MSSFFDLVDQNFLIPEKTYMPISGNQPNHATEPQAEPQIFFCCEKCDGVDFFLPLGSFSPRCKKCSPPVSRHLVGLEFFFDESGDRWQIVRLVDGGEEWVKLKADFTPVFSLR